VRGRADYRDGDSPLAQQDFAQVQDVTEASIRSKLVATIKQQHLWKF
jgi:hypothetical protein